MNLPSPPQQPNPPVEKQSNPSPDMQPRKIEDKDYEREERFKKGPGESGVAGVEPAS